MIFSALHFPAGFCDCSLALSRHIGKGLIMAVLFGLGAYFDFLSLWISFELARRFCSVV